MLKMYSRASNKDKTSSGRDPGVMLTYKIIEKIER